MFTGSISINTNKQECLKLLQSNIVVDLSGDNDPEINNIFVKASILLPPYQSSMFLVDGDIRNFLLSYKDYLSKDTPYQFLLLLLKGISIDRNYVFYLTKDELEMGYCQVILEYLQIMSNNNDPTSITKLLYLNNQMDSEQFIMYCNYIYTNINSTFMTLEPHIIQKMIYEIKPYLGTNPTNLDMNIFIISRIVDYGKPINNFENPMKGIY